MEPGVINHESIIVAPTPANKLLVNPTLCCGDGAGPAWLSMCVRVCKYLQHFADQFVHHQRHVADTRPLQMCAHSLIELGANARARSNSAVIAFIDFVIKLADINQECVN